MLLVHKESVPYIQMCPALIAHMLAKDYKQYPYVISDILLTQSDVKRFIFNLATLYVMCNRQEYYRL